MKSSIIAVMLGMANAGSAPCSESSAACCNPSAAVPEFCPGQIACEECGGGSACECPLSPSPAPTPPPESDRLGSFLVIGDWGHDGATHGNCFSSQCQTKIADRMDEEMAKLGDVKFVINVGDSFYPRGLTGKDDPQWDTKWRNRYSQELRSVPWHSVYGNHDYHQDPGVCSDNVPDGAQINADINNLDYFYMPDYNWYREEPELDLEIVGLDLNNYMNMWNNNTPATEHSFTDCRYTACEADCYPRMKNRAIGGFDLFKDRAAKTTAKNMLVFSHYPTDYWWDTSSDDPSGDFLASLSDTRPYVTYFGGHRHNTDQHTTKSIAPNNNWIVGGGGGWGCDGSEQGFVVGEISSDGAMTTRAVLVDPGLCCDVLAEAESLV